MDVLSRVDDIHVDSTRHHPEGGDVVVILLYCTTNGGEGVFNLVHIEFGLKVLVDNSLDVFLKSGFPCLFIEFSLSIRKLLLISVRTLFDLELFQRTLAVYKVLNSQWSCDSLTWSGMKLVNDTT